MNFVPGWSFDRSMAAQSRLSASGQYATVAPALQASPPRPAVSLSHLRTTHLEQGVSGTCYAHSPAQLFMVTAKALGYDVFAPSRHFIAWATKQEEGGGNPGEGGSPTDAIRAMTDQGVGVAHETIFPYPVFGSESAMAAALAGDPPQTVLDDAKKSHLQVPIPVHNTDQIVSLIDAASHPVVNGFQCPVEMQQQGTTFIESASAILGGHSILIWGYALPGVFDQYMWFELENWWGNIYRPLPTSLARQVDGYEPVEPNRTSSVWMKVHEVYLPLCQKGCEHVSATDVAGIARGIVTPSATADFHKAFIV